MIAAINSGSSSIKLTFFVAPECELARSSVVCGAQIDSIGEEPSFTAVDGAGHQLANERLETGAGHEDAIEFA